MELREEHTYGKEKEASFLYKIGMFAQMNHITIKTLRFYEEQGILSPAYVNAENGYRYYTMDQMAVIHQITALKQAGFTLDDIKRLKQGANEATFLAKKKASILEKIAELTKQLAFIEQYMNSDNHALDCPVLIKTLPSVIVATMEARIASYDDLFELMPFMGAKMEQLGCECALPEYCFTNYLEPVNKEDDILIETCEAVTEMKEDSNEIKFKTLPEVQAACIYHKGSYNNFSYTYSIVLRYIEENGYEICGPIRESHIDGIWNKDSIEEWLTEIQIPVKKKAQSS